MFCNVIVTRPFDQIFTYKLKKGQSVKEGSIVCVPFGKKKDQIGMVVELIEAPKPTKNFVIKEIGIAIMRFFDKWFTPVFRIIFRFSACHKFRKNPLTFIVISTIRIIISFSTSFNIFCWKII